MIVGTVSLSLARSTPTMTDSTFTLTVAAKDDEGTHYNLPYVVLQLQAICSDAGCTVFSQATGIGTDTETGDTEPIVIIQGYGPTDYVQQVGNDAAHFARTQLNQRAIGWFATEEDTYRSTALPS